jgi:AcrR family transcriptional regulator
MNKGAQTRKAILNTAHQMASQVGLEGLSLGTLAERMGLSKSGVFAHFGSREELVLALIDEVREEFGRRVFVPAINKPRGLPRLEAIFDGWLSHIANMRGGGCVIVAGASEFDDRPGPVRDRIPMIAYLFWRYDRPRGAAAFGKAFQPGTGDDTREISAEVAVARGGGGLLDGQRATRCERV